MSTDPYRERWSDESFRSRLRTNFDRLSYEDLAHENGDREYVIEKVQAYYGYDKEKADELLRDFERSL